MPSLPLQHLEGRARRLQRHQPPAAVGIMAGLMHSRSSHVDFVSQALMMSDRSQSQHAVIDSVASMFRTATPPIADAGGAANAPPVSAQQLSAVLAAMLRAGAGQNGGSDTAASAGSAAHGSATGVSSAPPPGNYLGA